MPAQMHKIASWAEEVTYVDLFAGPWQSQSVDYSDTSFGIALKRMTEAKATWAKLGRNVKMIAHLVEKDLGSYAKLIEAAKSFPEVETHCYPGEAQKHADIIAKPLPPRAFRFVVIDPKGIPDVRAFRKLIASKNTEVLINFMLQFANRFASSQDRMPPLEGWLGGLSDVEGSWRKDFAGLSGAAREAAITDRAREALRRMGNYLYAPALTVDETAAERPLYKLIYLSRHAIGLKVFRDAHVKALETQASYKSTNRHEARRRKSGMDDLFANIAAINPGERSALEISGGAAAGRDRMLEMLAKKPVGITWKDLWPSVLDACVLTHSQLGDCVRDLRAAGKVEVPNWASPAVKRPRVDFIIRLANGALTG